MSVGRAAAGLLCLAAAGCGGEPEARNGTRHFFKGPLNDAEVAIIRREVPGLTPYCVARLKAGGLDAIGDVPMDRCYVMTPRQRWRGLWRSDFEGSQFCAAPATACSFDTAGERVWLEFEERVETGRVEPSGAVYAVEFFGRRTVHPGLFGHLGTSQHEMIVDEVISIREVEAPPPPTTEAEQEAEWQRCEAEGTCIRSENLTTGEMPGR